ncbi:HU family DNA-binding protein [Prevotella sp. HUN102]|uniref:HU family DNA-binding protein n=1 Tax=Prevotella sp. HUN102 TaxID=1392486 RepID=UPI00048AF23D|nr:HU family DNA-binding protein [Prevotella sp. HUN102]
MITYKVKSEVMRIGAKKGKTMYYAAPVAQDEITSKQVEDRIINLTALSRADVRSAITALAEIVREEMFSGRTVDLADLGSFKVISTAKRVEKEEDVKAETLKTPRIQFFPKQEMLAQAKGVQRIIIHEEKEKDGNTPSQPEDDNP